MDGGGGQGPLVAVKALNSPLKGLRGAPAPGDSKESRSRKNKFPNLSMSMDGRR